MGAISRRRIDSHIEDLQNDEDSADHDTLKATTKNGVRNYRKCLVDYHVRKQEGNEQKMAVLSDRLYFLRITLLFTARRDRIEGSGGISEWSSDQNSRCPADAQHVQLGLIQTHVSQGQPSENSGKNDEDGYEASKDDPLGLGEFFSFCEVVKAGIGGVSSGCGGGGES